MISAEESLERAALAMCYRLHEANPAVFARLIAFLGPQRPYFGEVTVRFQDGAPVMVEKSESFR